MTPNTVATGRDLRFDSLTTGKPYGGEEVRRVSPDGEGFEETREPRNETSHPPPTVDTDGNGASFVTLV